MSLTLKQNTISNFFNYMYTHWRITYQQGS